MVIHFSAYFKGLFYKKDKYMALVLGNVQDFQSQMEELKSLIPH